MGHKEAQAECIRGLIPSFSLFSLFVCFVAGKMWDKGGKWIAAFYVGAEFCPS